jgi:hypothetical protein
MFGTRGGRLGTGDGQFQRIALAVVCKGALRETQLQFEVFDLLDSETTPSQTILHVLNGVFEINDV